MKKTLLILSIALHVNAAAYKLLPPSKHTKITILGTSNAYPHPHKKASNVAITVDGNTYLFGAGSGVASALLDTNTTAMHPSKIKKIFLHNLSISQTAGLPELIARTRTPFTKRGRLMIYGPIGTKHLGINILDAWDKDEQNRKLIQATNIEAKRYDTIYKDQKIRVQALRLKSPIFEYNYAFKIYTKDRTIIIANDNPAPNSLTKHMGKLGGVDILIHNVYGIGGIGNKPYIKTIKELKEFKNGLLKTHPSTRTLAIFANRTRPKMLVLTSQMYWANNKNTLIEMQNFCYVRTISPKRGDTIE